MSKPSYAVVDSPSLRMESLEVRRFPLPDGEVQHVVNLGPIRLSPNSADAANLGTLLIESCAAVTE